LINSYKNYPSKNEILDFYNNYSDYSEKNDYSYIVFTVGVLILILTFILSISVNGTIIKAQKIMAKHKLEQAELFDEHKLEFDRIDTKK
jgi:hypothetical protein